MPRALDAALRAAIIAVTGERVQLAELFFSSGTTRLTTAAQSILWNGFTWEAVGGLFDPDGFREVANGNAPGCRVRLSGVDRSITALVLSDRARGRKASVYEAALNPTTGQIIGTPRRVFDGYMNEGFDIVEEPGDFGGGTVTIETRFADKISDLSQRRGVRMNVHSHQREIPGAVGDTFLQHVASIQGRRIYWGSDTPPPLYSPPPGSNPANQGGGLTTPVKPRPPATPKDPLGGGLTNGGKTPWGSDPKGPGWGS